ncbi:MAG: hypothetical protein HY547_07780 [Elusimicrobia bacterium]|nr:hypothetical protein [Elusimicrobiota bacterium]
MVNGRPRKDLQAGNRSQVARCQWQMKRDWPAPEEEQSDRGGGFPSPAKKITDDR